MCLACELDALWYGEWEPPGAAATAGVPPAVGQEADHPENAAAAAARQPPASPQAAEMPANPVKPALRSGFFCEET